MLNKKVTIILPTFYFTLSEGKKILKFHWLKITFKCTLRLNDVFYSELKIGDLDMLKFIKKQKHFN